MTDTPPITSSLESTPPSSAAEQARIRRERREAKIKAGGTSRLNKITGLSGGLQRDERTSITTSELASAAHADPEEVDISEHFYETTPNLRPRNDTPNPSRPYPGLSSDPRQIDDEALRAIMLGLPQPRGSSHSRQSNRPSNPSLATGNPDDASDPAANDPMMAMLQQMMGGAGAEAGAIPSFPGLPPIGVPNQDFNGTATIDTYAYIWRIVHAAFALGFGLYISLTSGFIGTEQAREESAFSGVDLRAFYTFATIEAILQGTRFIFDKGQANQNGILGVILQFLPEPFRGYLKLFMNYRSIWTTTSADVMVLVFVLVAMNYWRTPQEVDRLFKT